jgi:aminopeptidase N
MTADRPGRWRRGTGHATVLVAATLVVAVTPASAAPPARPSGGRPGAATPGAPGIGDPLFPDEGNGGFDVTHYDLAMRYRPDDRTVTARTTVSARATQSLSRFDLDFDGNTVTGLTVDGGPASYRRDGEELVVTPARPVHRGARFRVTVDYQADPAATHHCAPPNNPITSGWLPTRDGFVTAGQPTCARSVFPGSDHPSDKASYTFRVTAPDGLTAVANGVPAGRREHGGETTWTYQQRVPMATELVQVAVGDYTVQTAPGPDHTTIRNVVPTSMAGALGKDLAVTGPQLAWMERQAGSYPFATYGVLAAPANFRFALECQTLTLTSAGMFGAVPQSYWSPVLAHELAHQWYGDSVAPARWADVWLNEGHASYYEASWADREGYASFVDRMHTAYTQGDTWRSRYGPVAQPSADNLFNEGVYDGGALVLYALREQVGAARFTAIERAWAARYAGGTGSTGQFIALASSVAHRDLHGFLTAWLYGTRTPPMPGHPDWTTDPVG